MNIKEFYSDLPKEVEADPIIMGFMYSVLLAAPYSFWQFKDELDFKLVVNGCGPKGVGDKLIPDSVWGLKITDACAIHDWMFTIFNDEAGFRLANQVFLDNMTRINKEKTKWNWLMKLRSRRILKYYYAVKNFGRVFFYDAHRGLYEIEENEKERKEYFKKIYT